MKPCKNVWEEDLGFSTLRRYDDVSLSVIPFALVFKHTVRVKETSYSNDY